MKDLKIEVHPYFKKVQAVLAYAQTLTYTTRDLTMELTARPYMYQKSCGYHITNNTGRQANIACSSSAGENVYMWFGVRHDFDPEHGNVHEHRDAQLHYPQGVEAAAHALMDWLVHGFVPKEQE